MSIEELLRQTLDERAARVTGDDDLAQNVIRARGRRRAVVGLSALVILVIVVALALSQSVTAHRSVVPDPRATAVPSVAPPAPTASYSGFVTGYRVVQGPGPTSRSSDGAPISATPRVEVRGTTTYLVTPTSSVALPSTVNGARSIQPAGTSWVVFTVSSGFTGGDTDSAAQILVVSPSGDVRALTTGAVRSIAVSPDGTQVASVETVETKSTWSVTLVVRRIADGGVVRTVALPYGSRGEWPYGALVWTSDGILASNQSGSVTAAGATVLVRQSVMTDEAPITGIFPVPSSTDLFVTFTKAGSTCLSPWVPAAAPVAILCGKLGDVTPLGNGRVLLQFSESDGLHALVADTTTRTVTVLPESPGLQQLYLVGLVADSATTVLVPDFANKMWWRWEVVTNTVEAAPLPEGAKAAISW